VWATGDHYFSKLCALEDALFLALKGMMPVSDALPYMWYNTPNIHLCTFRDFEALCAENQIRLLIDSPSMGINKIAFSKHVPNLFGEVAIYRVSAL
jgi:methionine biosynthesis protein MetW